MKFFVSRKLVEEECVRYTEALRAIGFLKEPDYAEIKTFGIERDASSPVQGYRSVTDYVWTAQVVQPDREHLGGSTYNPLFVPGFVPFHFPGFVPGFVPGFQGIRKMRPNWRGEPRKPTRRSIYAAILQSRRTIEFLVENGFKLSRPRKKPADGQSS